MKLVVLSENLQKYLPMLYRGISSRSQLPVLLNFLLETKNGKLQIKSTDLEMGIEVETPANIEEDGGITVPAKQFYDLISSLSQEKTTLSLQGKVLEIVTQKTKSTIQTVPKEEFPALYEERGQKILEIDAKELNESITPVAFCASSDVSRPALSGVLIEKKPNEVLFVATDGYRLSLKRIKKEGDSAASLLVPARLMREMVSSKEEGVATLYVSKNSNQVLCDTGAVRMIGRLIEAEYPSYQRIIPTEYKTRVLLHREGLERAVKIASVFARNAANIVTFDIKKNVLYVSSSAPSIGENVVEVEVQGEGEENQIAFNARYLLEILGALKEENIVFEMTGPLNPGVFKIKDDPSFLHLIMPIRAQG